MRWRNAFLQWGAFLLLAFLPVFVFAQDLPQSKAVAQVEVHLELVPALDCAEGQCTNGWGECFALVPDKEGIMNVDTLPPEECRSRKDGFAAQYLRCEPKKNATDEERCTLTQESELCALPNIKCSVQGNPLE